MMNRRNFIAKTGASALLATVTPPLSACAQKALSLDEWETVRADFKLDTSKIQMAQFLLASHPSSVRAAIEKYRKGLDDNPVEYYESNFVPNTRAVLKAAETYLGAKPGEIALTDSTTMGLSLLYTGLKLKEGAEILSTTHCHYSTEKSLDFAAQRTGATVRRINLYEAASQTTIADIVNRLKTAIQPKTRIVAVTFVHSNAGVKLPIKEMSAVIKEANKNRDASNRIYFCVDGVHGFGVEDINVTDLGCDFLVAGTHKWLFGPRGTGIIWAKEDAWDMVQPTIPPFSVAYYMWMNVMPEAPLNFYSKITPGGFHSFEHRWALKEAFEFHLNIGKAKIQNRTHQLSTMLKEGIQNIKHVKLHTPMSTTLSSGINSFEITDLKPKAVVEKLHKMNIIASTTPYKTVYARLTPCIISTEEEVMACIKVLERIKD